MPQASIDMNDLVRDNCAFEATRRPLNILLFAARDALKIGTVRDHVDALINQSFHNITVLDPRDIRFTFGEFAHFDVLVLHYSLVISDIRSLPEVFLELIRNFSGYKVLFLQDEYRWIDRTVAAIGYLGLDVLYTVVNEEVVDKLYHHESIKSVRRKITLTGFTNLALTKLSVPEFEDRSIDVGYRARKLSGWFGELAQEKWRIGEKFDKEASEFELKCDIAFDESSRLYGKDWIKFISNCKAMLGTESGVSVFDFSGDIQREVEAFELKNPHASFEEVKELFLKDIDGENVINVISPRVFEAAALRCLMVLYPGTYSGVLTPWKHYVPLERDHSNMCEVVAVLRDKDRAAKIIKNAYHEVALNPKFSFEAMVDSFDADLQQHAYGKITSLPRMEVLKVQRMVRFAQVRCIMLYIGNNIGSPVRIFLHDTTFSMIKLLGLYQITSSNWLFSALLSESMLWNRTWIDYQEGMIV